MHNAADPCSSANGNVFVFLNNRQERFRGLSFGADHAAKPLTKPTIRTPCPRNAIGIRVDLAGGGGRNRIGMVSKTLCSISERGRKVGDIGGRRRSFRVAAT